MERVAQRAHDLRAGHTGLLAHLAHGALGERLAGLDVPFGQVPAAVAVDHEPRAARIDHDAPCGLHRRELRGETAERSLRIGRNHGHVVAGLENFEYLRSGNPLSGSETDRKMRARRCTIRENHGLVGEIDGSVHTVNFGKDTQINEVTRYER